MSLTQLYFALCTTPGMSTHVVAACADTLQALTRSRKKMSIEDMRLPWKPIYHILSRDLFLTRREFEYTYVRSTMISDLWELTYVLSLSQLSWCMGYIADTSRRFFHPAAIDEMLATFVPQINGTNLDVCWKMSNLSFAEPD
jgi:proteasome activator subunit 4